MRKPTKPIENRKHHYVPQFLLRNFASERRDIIYAFDKWTGKQFGVAIADAAAERGYNTFDTDEASGCAEEFFTRIESIASPVIQRIVVDRRLPSITIAERAALVQFAIAQMLRSKNHRAIFGQIGEILRELADREGSPEFKAWVPTPNLERDKQALLMDLKRDLFHFAPYLANKDLMLFTATESHPLIIGDSPLIRTNTLNVSEFYGTTGLNSRGVEVYLPLSPTLALGFMCPTIGETMREVVGRLGRAASSTSFDYLLALELRRTLGLDPPNIDYLNSHQVISAERFLYSGSDDFSLVQEMVESDPSLRTGARLTTNQGLTSAQ
jgi:hypothetical protein